MRLLTAYVKPLLFCAVVFGSSACVTTGSNNNAAEDDEALVETGMAEFDAATKLLQRRRYSEAETALLTLSESSPELAGVWANLGIVYAKTDRNDQAVTALRRATRLNNSLAPAHNQLAVVYTELRQFRAAEDAYQAAINAEPGYAKALLNLAILYDARLNRPSAAVGAYRDYLAKAEDLSETQEAKVLLWIEQAEARANPGQN